MAEPVTNPEAIRFINERIRPAADKFASSYIAAVAHISAWEQLKDIIPNDAEVLIEDNRQREGISQITGRDVHAIAAMVKNIKDTLEANNNALRDIVFKVSVQKGS